MDSTIVRFMRKACDKYGSLNLSAYYTPKRDLYVFHINGRAVQNFDGFQFYQIPKDERMRMLLPLIKVGLLNNLGNNNHNFIIGNYTHGKRIK